MYGQTKEQTGTMSIRVSERERRQIEEKVQERESRSEAMSAGKGGVY